MFHRQRVCRRGRKWPRSRPWCCSPLEHRWPLLGDPPGASWSLASNVFWQLWTLFWRNLVEESLSWSASQTSSTKIVSFARLDLDSGKLEMHLNSRFSHKGLNLNGCLFSRSKKLQFSSFPVDSFFPIQFNVTRVQRRRGFEVSVSIGSRPCISVLATLLQILELSSWNNRFSFSLALFLILLAPNLISFWDNS